GAPPEGGHLPRGPSSRGPGRQGGRGGRRRGRHGRNRRRCAALGQEPMVPASRPCGSGGPPGDPWQAGWGGRRAPDPSHARAVLRRGPVVRGVPPGQGRAGGGAPVQRTGGEMIAAASGASSGLPGHVVEIVLAVLLIGGGIRSLLVWFRTEFDAESPRDRFLYSLFASA